MLQCLHMHTSHIERFHGLCSLSLSLSLARSLERLTLLSAHRMRAIHLQFILFSSSNFPLNEFLWQIPFERISQGFYNLTSALLYVRFQVGDFFFTAVAADAMNYQISSNWVRRVHLWLLRFRYIVKPIKKLIAHLSLREKWNDFLICRRILKYYLTNWLTECIHWHFTNCRLCSIQRHSISLSLISFELKTLNRRKNETDIIWNTMCE